MVAGSVIAELCIYILTWNVASNSPSDISLSDALGIGNGTSNCPDQRAPDIYVIALQEVSSKPKNQIMNIFNDNPWVHKVRQQLDDSQYVKVETEQLQGILIMMFAQGQHITHMNDIETESTRTGFAGLWGNKGAVSIRMSLYGTGVTFVGAHLAAHDHELKERVIDYNQIVDNHHYKTNKYATIFDHDFVFWFGDLNFRLSGEESAWDVRNMIEHDQLDALFQNDQLRMVRQTGNAFALLEEQQPSFAPTFKFVEGTSDYNLKRRPAWCDRILYRVQTDKYPDIKLSLQQLSYNSYPKYTLSDHKPVSASFLYKIEADTKTADEIYEMTHGGTSSETPLASVIILIISAYVTVF